MSETNYSNIAHIVGASRDGPRGNDPMPLSKRNQISNLMLVCTPHHKLIDSKENELVWPKERLALCKQVHEKRVAWVTAFLPNQKTFVLRMRSKIGNQNVVVPFDQICDAILPLYPEDPDGLDIDLTAMTQPTEHESWKVLADEISLQVESLYRRGVAKDPEKHISVFALAPIPLLVHLGSCLSNKIKTDLFQRHRSGESWTWQESTERVEFEIKQLQQSSEPSSKVALVLALSGPVSMESLPNGFRDRVLPIYEISPKNNTMKTPMLIRSRKDLEAFQLVYHEVLSMVMAANPGVSEIHLFAAVPAPVAVMCGRELLPKAHPSLMVYEFNKHEYKYALRVN